MDSFLTCMEPGVQSELVDLGPISLKVLRRLDDAALHRALRHAAEQTGHAWVASEEEQPYGARID